MRQMLVVGISLASAQEKVKHTMLAIKQKLAFDIFMTITISRFRFPLLTKVA